MKDAHRRTVIELSPAARDAVHRATIALLRHRGSDRDPIATAGEALDEMAAVYVEMVEAEIAGTLPPLAEPDGDP